MNWPFKTLTLEGYKNKFKYARLLRDGSELKFSTVTKAAGHTTETAGENDVMLQMPVQAPGDEVPVIEMIL
ncbi:hypothetical protein [Niabella hibiscisoli]|uniref:hypothetical protein n=1 Tax=Niabella hibiscisoli TaxID=1825928 RepID=UPI001F10F893|nr:hypothetical protein [Niabella hibiscisoli]MCH5718384.1 hypothetical protein [Niabella hibiscisoli]